MEPPERVALQTFYELGIAEIMAGRLRADGVPAYVTGGATASLWGGLTGVTLWVHADDERAARDLLGLPPD